MENEVPDNATTSRGKAFFVRKACAKSTFQPRFRRTGPPQAEQRKDPLQIARLVPASSKELILSMRGIEGSREFIQVPGFGFAV